MSSVTLLGVGTTPPHQLLGSFQSASVVPMNLPSGAQVGIVEVIQSDEVPEKSKFVKTPALAPAASNKLVPEPLLKS